MNILFLAPYVPSRIRVRPFHLIKELAKRHRVHVIALGVPAGEKAEGIEELFEATEQFRVVPHSRLRGLLSSLLALPTSVPMCAAYCRSAAMKSEVERALDEVNIDVIHVEHLRAASFAPVPAGVPVVFDSVDCLTGLFHQIALSKPGAAKRLVAAEEAWKLGRYEPRTLRRFDEVVITSDSEREALLSLDSELDVEVLSNGVDTDYFAPSGGQKSPRRIVFSGKMGYQPNADAAIWFAEQVFPRIRDKWSDAEFVIAGNDPPEAVRRLSERPGITVTGYVADLRPYLDSAVVSVAPMRVAVGVQNKVLEAMAMALPVVMSPLAARSLEDCESDLIAVSPDEYFDAISGLIERPDDAADLGMRNRAYVQKNHSWESSTCKLEAIYSRAIARRGK